MDFEEFHWAEGYGEEAIGILKSYYEKNEAVPASVNDKYEPAVAYKLINGNVGTVDSKKTIPHYMVMFI